MRGLGDDRVGNFNQAGVSQDTNEIMCEVYGELPTQVLWGSNQHKHFFVWGGFV